MSTVTTLDGYEKHRLSEWPHKWEDLSDVIVIAAIAALILMTLFAAFIVDGLGEYFNDTKSRRAGVQRVPFSARSKRQHFAEYRDGIFSVRISSQKTAEERNVRVDPCSDVPRRAINLIDEPLLDK